jgi:hypothetical protein
MEKTSGLVAIVLLACMIGGAPVVASSSGPGGGLSGTGDAAESSSSGAAEARGSASGAAGPETRVVLYYLHGDRRCKTCRSIEAYAEEALRSRFGAQLRDGALEWQAINFEEAGNEHYVKDFALSSSSLVLAELSGDRVLRHEVLQKAWLLVGDRDEFQSYVVHAVKRYLG